MVYLSWAKFGTGHTFYGYDMFRRPLTVQSVLGGRSKHFLFNTPNGFITLNLQTDVGVLDSVSKTRIQLNADEPQGGALSLGKYLLTYGA